MGSRKSKEGSKEGSKGRKGPSPWTPFARQTLGIGVTLGVLTLAMSEVRSEVISRPEYLLRPQSMVLGELPYWMRSSESVPFDCSRWMEGRTLLDEDLDDVVRSGLLSVPWVESVGAIERRFPNMLSVRLTPRKPVAQVREGFKRTFVDAGGVCLPESAYKSDLELPFIEGLGDEAPAAGKSWNHPVLLRAIDLLRMWHERNIAESNPIAQVVRVECATPSEILRGKPDFILHVRRRVQIYVNSGVRDGEVPLAGALSNLEKILLHDPQLDHVRSYVDLRWRTPRLQ
ncbi:MAG: cell division protein FtsQ/DivIB [Planctomycetota bacterium]